MKILVLGGTGTMGRPLVEILSQNNSSCIFVTSRTRTNSTRENVHYLQGDAHNLSFLSSIMNESWDVIIDFMIYSVLEFRERIDLILANTNQYIFISSARVYSNCEGLITEKTPRLLDINNDENYVNSDEYAIVKAMQENILFEHKNDNWTIIRPYITYNSNKFQLGVFQKEQWLYRALQHKKVIFPEDMGHKITSYTYAEDVALAISRIIGNSKSFGESIHIANSERLSWNEIIGIYKLTLEKIIGCKMEMKMLEESKELFDICNPYQIIYDRLFDRKFCNKKLESIIGKFEYTSVEQGVIKALSAFIINPIWDSYDARFDGWADKKTGEMINLSGIYSLKDVFLYFRHRFK